MGDTNTPAPPPATGPQRRDAQPAASNAPAPPTTPPPGDAHVHPIGRVRRTVDLIPTTWLFGGVAALALATTAALVAAVGGLADAPVRPAPEVAVGEPFAATDLTMTVLGARLTDDPGNAGAFPDADAGERLLVVEVEAVNTFDSARWPTASAVLSPMLDGIRVQSVGGTPVEAPDAVDDLVGDLSAEGLHAKPLVSHADDGTFSPLLQPDLPTTLLLAWVVGPDDLHDGEELVLTLPDSTRYTGQSVVSGEYWWDVVVGATVTIRVEEEVTG